MEETCRTVRNIILYMGCVNEEEKRIIDLHMKKCVECSYWASMEEYLNNPIHQKFKLGE